MIFLKLSFSMALNLSTAQYVCVNLLIVLFKCTLSFDDFVDKVYEFDRSNHGTVISGEICRLYFAR